MGDRGYGIAVLSVNATLRSLAPGLTGWRSAAHPYLLENNRLDPVSSAIRHEMGHPAFPGIFTLGAALDLFAETGVSMVSERISELGERLLSGIQRAGYSIRSSVEAGTRSGILLIECDEAAKVTAALRENAIWVSARAGGIRASVHAYNVADEVDLLCDSLAAMR
jgi:selenocysteine lyase/cysteine desulfurase